MTDLDNRIGRVERANRRLTFGIAGLGLLCGYLLINPGGGSTKRTNPTGDSGSRGIFASRVTTRELVIVDKDGEGLGKFYVSGSPGFAYIELRNGKAKNRCEIHSDDIAFLNGQSQVRAFLGGTDGPLAGLGIRNESGKTCLSVNGSSEYGSGIMIGDGDDSKIQMGVRGSAPYMDYYSPSRKDFEKIIPNNP